ncbi:hypothetical protein BpHYR1_034422 [Brachionus plicatilis]|uniref:Uncharacterized protein n=1 Tax=Brachionus plicatilis TaxID=10195 RepID=A0A3M7TAE8_BRAPC|nr:hypothetical protein BpHYR1_034422 [Brachionus plicatilis]
MMSQTESNEVSLNDTSELSESMLEDEEELSSGIDQFSRNSTQISKSKKSSPITSHSKLSKNIQQSLLKMQSSSINKNVENNLKQNIKDYFAYNLKSSDFAFLKELYHVLNKIEDTWNQIGFNTETKQDRLGNFYQYLSLMLLQRCSKNLAAFFN